MVGYTKKIAAAVWVGNEKDEQAIMDKDKDIIWGSDLPGPIWKKFMSDATKAMKLPKENTKFNQPNFVGDENPAVQRALAHPAAGPRRRRPHDPGRAHDEPHRTSRHRRQRRRPAVAGTSHRRQTGRRDRANGAHRVRRDASERGSPGRRRIGRMLRMARRRPWIEVNPSQEDGFVRGVSEAGRRPARASTPRDEPADRPDLDAGPDHHRAGASWSSACTGSRSRPARTAPGTTTSSTRTSATPTCWRCTTPSTSTRAPCRTSTGRSSTRC